MTSLWLENNSRSARPLLDKNITADAVVIGAGMAGILTAWHLQNKGLKTVVLERGLAGHGQTGHTTAKITAQHGLIYSRLSKSYSSASASVYARLNLDAIDRYEALINQLGVDCGFRRAPAYVYSTGDAAKLEQEHQAAGAAGIPCALTREVTLPFSVAQALRFENQAMFDPVALLYAAASRLEIYENTAVERVEDNTVITEGGKSVKAGTVIYACHYPFTNIPGWYFARLSRQRSYVIALEGAARLDGMYIDEQDGGLSLRNHGELLLLGGGGHRTGHNSAGGSYDMLVRRARELFPSAREVLRWSAQDCMTADHLPYIGNFSAKTPNHYVATGFQKWGMSTSMVAAGLLADMVTGVPCEGGELFSPSRHAALHGAGRALEHGAATSAGLLKRFLALPLSAADGIGRGRGGIVWHKGRRMGVYRDDRGELFAVNPVCPHLGCRLEWNPDDKSWDCPCHGSRFDCRGELLDGPAERNL